MESLEGMPLHHIMGEGEGGGYEEVTSAKFCSIKILKIILKNNL